MAKLTKAQIKTHNQALELLKKDRLNLDEKFEVLEKWNEGAVCTVAESGAFFTPPGFARDFAIDAGGPKIIDLCAGIGMLAFFVAMRHDGYSSGNSNKCKIVCVERNPDFVEVGKKLLPEAEWFCCDVFDFDPSMVQSFDATAEKFDWAISNPPFGKIRGDTYKGCYSGGKFEYKVIELASRLAKYGTFIIPSNSAPFKFSGHRHYEDVAASNADYQKFLKQTGIELTAGCGVDTAFHREDWKNTNILCEIVLADFEEMHK